MYYSDTLIQFNYSWNIIPSIIRIGLTNCMLWYFVFFSVT